MKGTRVMIWDWKDQPDIDELNQILNPSGVYARRVDTGSDDYAIVFSGEKMTDKSAQDAFDKEVEGHG